MFDQPAIWSVVGIPNFFRKRKCKSNYDVFGGMRVGGNYRFEVCNKEMTVFPVCFRSVPEILYQIL